MRLSIRTNCYQDGCVPIHGQQVNNLKYAADANILWYMRSDPQSKLEQLCAAAGHYELREAAEEAGDEGQHDTGLWLLVSSEYLGNQRPYCRAMTAATMFAVGLRGCVHGSKKLLNDGELWMRLQQVFSVFLSAFKTWTLDR